ncbi:thioredoxin family protein [Lactiplantibacillus plantarum]|uniref:thioredoxin family protein n=1 Tax=Lactiplantibacillus plantarum TaxID=1590 RepID=UPI000EB647C8|nr:thioredoxin family protein [Lactiplantibacillus plantarum]AYC73332.1 thioredoxin [Lactiplantibacillus plantarum]AYC73354.1 thioredoxin [Lactiplantibacillus plantarum]MBW1622762.1 thioredoxin family protein [Lactiplantibacillus plantarum]
MEQLSVMNKKEFDKKLKNGKYILVFIASWCPDCSFIKPHLPEIEQEFKDYTFISVDHDENTELAQELNIFGIPSFVIFRDGQEIGRLVNKDRKTKEEVENFITNTIN